MNKVNYKSKLHSTPKKIAKTAVRKRVTEPQVRATVQPNSALNNFNELIISHRECGRKLARTMLSRWHVHMHVDEIDSIVDWALCEAARRFSPERGVSFTTFLFYYMRGCLIKTICAAKKATATLLSDEVFSKSANDTHAQIEEDFADTSEYSHVVINSIEFSTPEALAIKKERMQIFREACSRLDELERTIVERTVYKQESVIAIAKSLGYGRCHLSRVKKGALNTLSKIIAELETEKLTVSLKTLDNPSQTAKKPENVLEFPLRKTRRRMQISHTKRAVNA